MAKIEFEEGTICWGDYKEHKREGYGTHIFPD